VNPNPSRSESLMHLLRAHQLEKHFGNRTVVNGVSFSVDRAEVVGLLGRNGAGKTTSFRMTIGMLRADGGKVLFDGQDVSRLPMYKRANRGMGYLSQEPSILRRATVEQNLMAFLEMEPLSKQERYDRLEVLLHRFDLDRLRAQSARTLSGGERRKLEIARSLIKNPKLILLDEPFSGVDPLAVEDLQKEILRLRNERGIAMLITDHNVQQTLRVCDRAYIIVEGQILAEGTPRELIRNDRVREAYLGSMFRGDEFDDLIEARAGLADAVREKIDRLPPTAPDESAFEPLDTTSTSDDRDASTSASETTDRHANS